MEQNTPPRTVHQCTHKSIWLILPMLAVMLAGIGNSQAAHLQLSHDPLFLSQGVPPAIIITFDNSRSMEIGFFSDDFRGYNWRNDPNLRGRPWRYSHHYPTWNVDNEPYFFDPQLNKLYYNPNFTYHPPIKADGSSFPDSNPTAARVNGLNPLSATVDLTNNFRGYYRKGRDAFNTTFNTLYINFDGQRAFYFTHTGEYPNMTFTKHVLTDHNELVNFANWFSYYSTRESGAKAATSLAFASFGANIKLAWQLLNSCTSSSSPECSPCRLDDTYDDGTPWYPNGPHCANQYSPALTDLGRFKDGLREDFFNWLFTIPTDIGTTPTRSATLRAGELLKQEKSYRTEGFGNKLLSCQQNFHIVVTDGLWNGDNRNGVFQSPTQDDQSLTHLPGDSELKYGAYDYQGEQAIYDHSLNNVLADAAFHYWKTDLMPGLDNNVKRFKKDYSDKDGNTITVPPGQDEWDIPAFVWNPKNNPAYWQHMVNYNVIMGMEPAIVTAQKSSNPPCPVTADPDPWAQTYAGLRSGSCDWTDKLDEGRIQVNDIWHAGVNSRGNFFSANDPQELIDALTEIVSDILERTSRGAASSVSSSVITSGSLAFSPGFDSSHWSGLLTAKQVDNDGSFVSPAVWDLACNLTGGNCTSTGSTVAKQTTRKVFTYNNNSRIKFSDSSAAKGIVKSNIEAAGMHTRLGIDSSILADYIIAYVKGDQDQEQSNGGKLRNRESVLSDIIHGSPIVMRGPSEGYDDSKWPNGSAERNAADSNNGYLDFQIANKNRENMVFVGSNTGMLHAVKAEDGEEKWSYIPSAALKNIHKLADPQFEHWSFVDNTPVINDAFFNNKWHSVLIGGMRYGGQSFFAIDVTKGVNDGKPKILWEFSDSNDPDMGYSYGQAQIVRLSGNGKWVALIPNGYNNSKPDYSNPKDPRNHTSSTGNAVLFVVELETGKLLAKLDTGVGSPESPNGLATPIAVDSAYFQGGNRENNRGKAIDIGTDYAYAGDLFGNLWRFDLRSDNPKEWGDSITKVVAGSRDRPITIQPKVVAVPDDDQTVAKDVVVIFGTGKYIEIPDRSISIADQYLVGVYDGLGEASTPAQYNHNFLGRSFVEQRFTSNSGRRTLSNYLVDVGSKDGWRIRLTDEGERIVNPLTLFGSQIAMATSTIPGGEDPCVGGGSSWLLAFDPVSGGKPAVNVFAQVVGTTVGPDGTPVTQYQYDQGVQINDLIVGSPSFLENQGGGNVNVVVEGLNNVETINIKKFTWRRRNWTNLLNE